MHRSMPGGEAVPWRKALRLVLIRLRQSAARAPARTVAFLVIVLLSFVYISHSMLPSANAEPASAASIRGGRARLRGISVGKEYEEVRRSVAASGTAPTNPNELLSLEEEAQLHDAQRPVASSPPEVVAQAAALLSYKPATAASHTAATKGIVALSDAVRGLPANLQPRYAAQRNLGRFECSDGSKSLASFDSVNDDFCDCPDGSDEPGTSACSGVLAEGAQNALPGFACGWALGAGGPHWAEIVIRFGAVNDGICDCCGGQDEWELDAVKCPDTCALAQAADDAEANKALEGSRAREELLHRHLKSGKPSKFKEHDGGADNAFIAAALEGCASQDDGDFKFDVCLFDSVKQKDHRSGQHFTLGKGGEWSTFLWENGEQRKDYGKLIMGNGDFCYASKAPRRAEIVFECDKKQYIGKVQEAQVCVYEVIFHTPAACRPLEDHHST